MDGPIVLYDGDCGFCEVMLALVLKWDRPRRLAPVPIQSARGERLLSDMPSEDRLKSWHLIDGDRAIHSGAAAIPLIFAGLPWGAPVAHLASRYPRGTLRAYGWVAGHRALLGRSLRSQPRAWAARVIAERER